VKGSEALKHLCPTNLSLCLFLAAAMALSQVQQLQICFSRHNVNSAIAPLARHPLPPTTCFKLVQRNTAVICHAAEAEQQQKVQVQPEAAVPGMAAYLDSLKWAKDGLVPVIVQVSTILNSCSCNSCPQNPRLFFNSSLAKCS
jgi:hypothetical protein